MKLAIRFLVASLLLLLISSSIKAQPRLDPWGDLLPAGAVFRTGTLRAQHEVTGSLIFSPDGKNLAAAAYDRTIRLWDAESGREIRRFVGHTNQITCLAFSLDGKALASGSYDRTLRLWDVGTGKERLQYKGQQVHPTEVAFGPGGKWIASSDGWSIRFWETDTGKEIRSISQLIFSISISPDGNTVAGRIHQGPAKLWDTTTGKELYQFPKTESDYQEPVFMPDGKTLLMLDDEGGTFWDLKSRQKLQTTKGLGFPIAISVDDKLIASGNYQSWMKRTRSDPPIRLWDAATGKEIRRLRGHQDGVFSLAIAPDGKTIASLGEDHSVRRWDINTGQELGVRVGHQNSVTAISFATDGKLLASGSTDRTLRIWNPYTGEELRQLRADHEIVQGVAFLQDDQLVSQNEVVPADDSRSPEKSVRRIRLWEAQHGRQRSQFDIQGISVGQVAFSPVLGRVASGTDTAIRFSNLTGKEVETISSDHHRIEGMAYSPNGKLLAVTKDTSVIRLTSRVMVWDVAAGKELWRQEKRFKAFRTVAFSPDGRVVVTGGGEIRFWDSASGDDLGQLPEGYGFAAFSPDGRTLATVGEGSSVVLWEVSTRQVRCRFAGHQISCLAFSPDGRLLGSGGVDTLVMVWDVTGRMDKGIIRATNADAKAIEGWWVDLSREDSGVAFQALWSLVASPREFLDFVKTRVPVISVDEAKRIPKLISDLDSDDFNVRDKASSGLEALGMKAEADLRHYLEGKPTVEAGRRAERLLAKLNKDEKPMATPTERQAMRLLEVLEQIGTKEAKQLLLDLAERGQGQGLRKEARASLERMGKR
jgi:WD40 repeat protein